jgi:hypothetical protein
VDAKVAYSRSTGTLACKLQRWRSFRELSPRKNPVRFRYGWECDRPPTKVKFIQVSVTVPSSRLLKVRWKGSVFAGSFQSEKFREVSGGDRLKVSAREIKCDRGKLTIQMQRT